MALYVEQGEIIAIHFKPDEWEVVKANPDVLRRLPGETFSNPNIDNDLDKIITQIVILFPSQKTAQAALETLGKIGIHPDTSTHY